MKGRPGAGGTPAGTSESAGGGSPIGAPVEHSGRRGFLPIETNWFDRLFIGVVGHVALNLLWMRFLEGSLPLIVATVLGLAWIVVVMRWG